MRRLAAIVRRETLGIFTTPGIWVAFAAFAALLGAILVAGVFRTGEVASLRGMLVVAAWALLVLVPAISMRSIADEFRQGTWETLFSAPVSPWTIALGKYLACLLVLAVALAVPIVAGAVALETVADPDPGEIASGFLGLFLAGGAFLAIGLFASGLTSNLLLAYLLPLFLLAAIAAGSRFAAAAAPPALAGAILAADPVRRVEDFVLGLVDTAHAAHFLLVIVAALVATAATLGRIRDGGWDRGAATLARRAGARLAAGVFLVGCLAAAAAGTAFLSTPSLRVQIDATKTRAYTLAPSSVEFLRGLDASGGDGAWWVSVLVAPERTDPAALRRIDEVLRRIAEANPGIRTERLDPADPAGGERYERMLERLVAAHGPTIARWEPALERGLVGFEELRRFATDEAVPIRELLAGLAPGDPQRPQLEQVAAAFEQVAGQGEPFSVAVRALLSTDASRPLPDWEGARSALVANDRYWADQLAALADLLRRWATAPAVAEPIRRWARTRADPFETMAAARKETQYALETLPPLRLGEVGRAVAGGEAVVVSGPRGAVAIPAWRLFPAASAAPSGRAALGLDFAGRGEEAILGALRSLTLATPPMVAFVHAEDGSLLERRGDGSDLAAVVDLLRSARLDVREWAVAAGGERPLPGPGQKAVWIVVPPLKREGLQVSDRERRLLQVSRELAATGQPTLLTLARSLLPLFGQPDPWVEVAAAFGAEVETGRVVLELAALSPETTETRPWQVLDRFARSHPIGQALDGHATFLNHPIPTRPAAGAVTLAAVAPAAGRWLEDDWRRDGAGIRTVPEAKRFAEPLPVAVAMERVDAPGAPVRRAVVVGSGGWLLSSVADAGQSLGGSRFALAHPGNRELLLASVGWLAGEPSLVAGGVSGREVPRVGEIGESTRLAWFVALAGGVPFGLVVTGVAIAARRRVSS